MGYEYTYTMTYNITSNQKRADRTTVFRVSHYSSYLKSGHVDYQPHLHSQVLGEFVSTLAKFHNEVYGTDLTVSACPTSQRPSRGARLPCSRNRMPKYGAAR